MRDRPARRPVRRALATLAALALAGTAPTALAVLPAPAGPVDVAPRTDDSILDACTGNSPIVCTLDLPPGHYDVTVELGDRFEAASTRVEAESRRVMVDEVTTAPGQRAHRSFTMNVRAQEGQQNDHGIGKGAAGLTLTFAGDAPALHGIGVRPAAESVQRLFLLGDSTVTDQEEAPYTGWGQVLPRNLERGVSVVNHSGSGESTTSFLQDPRMWQSVDEQLRPGDVALIQLAHNDKETAAEKYRENLRLLIDGVRARGAMPVLVTPIVRHRFEDGKLTDVGLIHTGAGSLPQHIRDIAAERDVPLIDLTARTQELVEGLGPEASAPLYLIAEKGDRTHTSGYGAGVYSSFVAEELRRTGLVPEHLWTDVGP